MTSKDTEQKPERRLGDFMRPDAGGGHRPRASESFDPSKVKPPQSGTGVQPPVAPAPPAAEEFVSEESIEERDAKQRMQLFEQMGATLEPIKDYRAYLEQQGISEDKAADIVDAILTDGYYEETIPLTKRSVIRLRTRCQLDTLRLHSAMGVQRPLFEDAVNELMVRYNMAASLAAFKEETFSFPEIEATRDDVEELFDIRLRFVERLPQPLFSRISIKLAQFDRVTMAVMREGVAENF